MQPRSYIRTVLILLAIVIAYTAYQYSQRNPDVLRFTASGDTAYGYGYTDSRSDLEIASFLRQNPDVKHLVFVNMPGTHDSLTNLKIAQTIRRKGLTTHVRQGGMIASGAVDLFLAGTQRTLECGARIGVHSWRDAYGRTGQDAGKDPLEVMHEAFLRSIDIDPDFYAFTRNAAPPDGMYWLTLEDMKRFNLLTSYPEC